MPQNDFCPPASWSHLLLRHRGHRAGGIGDLVSHSHRHLSHTQTRLSDTPMGRLLGQVYPKSSWCPCACVPSDVFPPTHSSQQKLTENPAKKNEPKNLRVATTGRGRDVGRGVVPHPSGLFCAAALLRPADAPGCPRRCVPLPQDAPEASGRT